MLLLSFTIVFIFLTSKVFSNTTEFGYLIKTNSHFIKRLIANQPDLIIDHVTKTSFELYGPKGLSIWLDTLAVEYSALQEVSKSIQSNYPSPEEVEEKLKELANKYSQIMTLKEIGRSHKGRPLYLVKISDNPNIDEIEPEFKYIANMHGDEIVGRELMVMFIQDLLEKYTSGDSTSIHLVNNTEIFIVPSMNPDGADKRRRGNGKYTDLNRDFPDFTTRDNSNTTKGRAPETIAIMNLSKSRNFSLSANFHGGTEVVNYPWDTKAEDFPLMNYAIDISREYAAHVPSMKNSSQFKDGITNGHAWYEVNGGMQDWSYFWHNDLQITIELSHKKWPRFREIPSFYKKNRHSLFKFVSQIHQGAGFNFLDNKATGTVEISTAFGDQIGTYAFEHGEFYKVLPVGSYEFIIKSKGKRLRMMTRVKAPSHTNTSLYKQL